MWSSRDLAAVFAGLPYTEAIAVGSASCRQLARARRTDTTTTSSASHHRRGPDRPPTASPSSQPPPAIVAAASASGSLYLPGHHGEWNRLAATTIPREYHPAALEGRVISKRCQYHRTLDVDRSHCKRTPLQVKFDIYDCTQR